MKRLLVAFGTVGLVLFCSVVARPCMCGVTDAESAFLGTEVVFIGKVTKIVHTKQAHVAYSFKQSGTLEERQKPQWGKWTYGARVVTLEISEGFKGTANKTVEILTAVYDNGATCGVNFRTGESYLVYAYYRGRELSADQAKLPKDHWTKEMHLKADTDRYNERLPILGTTICSRTEHMRWAKDDVDVIRRILNGETIPKEQPKRVRIIN